MRRLFTVSLFVLFISFSISAQWQQVGLNGENIRDLAVNGSSVFAAATGEVGQGGVYRSDDNGTTWTDVTGTQPRPTFYIHAVDGSVFTGRNALGLYRSLDNGSSWTQVGGGLPSFNCSDFAKIGSTLFVITTTAGPYKSTNNGVSFIKAATIAAYNGLLYHNNILYAGGTGGFYKALNNGVDWSGTNAWTNGGDGYDLTSIGNTVYGAAGMGIYYTSDNDATLWKQLAVSPGSGKITRLISYNNAIISASSLGGVYFSTDNGATWFTRTGLATNEVYALAAGGGYLYAGTIKGNGVWRLDLSSVTSVGENNLAEKSFKLGQNYPNPFNPSTAISYSVPEKAGVVNLSVYNVLGNLVETLVNKSHEAGNYTVNFDASKYSSGIYYYTLRSGIFSETKKMMLIK